MSRRPPLDDDFEEYEDEESGEPDWDLIKEDFPEMDGLDELDWIIDHIDEDSDWYEE